MPASKITFNGINRAVSDYSNAGSCEELINLRPTDTGLNPVKDFAIIMRNIPWHAVWVHNVGARKNYIAKLIISDGERKIISFWHIDEKGDPLYQLGDSIYAPLEFDDNSVHFAATGNMFTISIADKGTGTYNNFSYQWKGDAYIEIKNEALVISRLLTSTRIDQDDIEPFDTSVPFSTATGIDYTQMADSINDGFNILEAEHPTVAFGRFLVAICLRTKDGEEFWTSKWMGTDMDEAIKVDSLNNAGFQRNSNGHTIDWYDSSNDYLTPLVYKYVNNTGHVRLGGCTYSVVLPSIPPLNYDEDTSFLSEICVYASRPERYINTDDPSIITWGTTGADDNTEVLFHIPIRENEDYHPEDQLLYLQERIPISSLVGRSKTINLKFGGVVQTTSKTMEVDAGMVRRYGDILSYNNRLHYYGSTSETFVHSPYVVRNGLHELMFAYVRIKKPDGSSLLFLSEGWATFYGSTPLILYPNANATNIYFRLSQSSSQIYQADLRPSNRYNFAYSKAVTEVTDDAGLLAELNAIDTFSTSFYTDEPQDLNVTEQYNPFVFDVSHSYRAPGAILDVQPQMVSVPDVSFGDYPLNLFTDKGVYALTQGSGTVLYGNLIPVTDLVSERNTAVTDHGTFFVAAGGLWVIAGRRATLVSYALHEGPHKYIRAHDKYQLLAYSKETYDISPYESQVTFKEFLKNAALSFNRYRDEIIVSNPSFEYSYVLNLLYRQWFKITQKLMQSTVGSGIATTLIDTNNGTADSCVLDCANAIQHDEDTHTARLLVTRDDGTSFFVTMQFSASEEEQGQEPGETVHVTGIDVSPSSKTIVAGATTTLDATIYPPNATNQNVIWSSSNASVATVSNGVVRGLSAGSARITATTEDGELSDYADITVTAAVQLPTFNVSSINVVEGHTRSIYLDNEAEVPVIFRVTDTGSADVSIYTGEDTPAIPVTTVMGDGYAENPTQIDITGTAIGSFTIEAINPNSWTRFSTCEVTVIEDTIHVTRVQLNKHELNMSVGDRETLFATVSPNSATDKSVTWSTSNSSAATVNNRGTVTAVGVGTATITVTSVDNDECTDTCLVTVTAAAIVPVTGITLNRNSVSIEEGATFTLVATITPTNASDKSVTWASSDSTKVSVSGGVLTAESPTTDPVTITATANGGTNVSATCSVSVEAALPGLTVSPDSLTFPADSSDEVRILQIITTDEWTAENEV